MSSCFFVSCWIRDSSNKRTYMYFIFIFLLIDSIKYGRISKTVKEHAFGSPRAIFCYHIVWEHTLKNLYNLWKTSGFIPCLMSKLYLHFMKSVVATDSSNNFLVGWTPAGSTWLLTHPDSLKLLAAFVICSECFVY